MSDDQITLAELAERSGIPARTIRFYISRGILKGPTKAGRGAAYTTEHLARLTQIKALQAEGRVLSEIGLILRSGQEEKLASPTAWLQYAISEDIVVWAKADVSPWRSKQIRDAISAIASRLETQEE